jgi:hypothetical protein
MPFRFRRSFGPRWLKLNVSKTGLSVSSGVPGFHVNEDLSGRRKKPTRITVGLPGTGLSYYEDLGRTSTPNLPPQPLSGAIEQPKRRPLHTLFVLFALFVLAIAIGMMAH